MPCAPFPPLSARAGSLPHGTRSPQPSRPSAAWLLAAATSALLLTACGGGGGGSDAPASPETYHPDGTLTAVYRGGLTVSGLRSSTGGSSPVVRILDYAVQPTTQPVACQGQTLSGASVLATARREDLSGTPSLAQSTNALSFGPLRFCGATDDLAGGVTVFTRRGDLPATAQPGDGGALHEAARYSDANQTTLVGYTLAHWTLERLDANHAFLCVYNVQLATDRSTRTGLTSDCLLLQRGNSSDASDTVVGARLQMTTPEGVLTFE